jgi:integrase
MSKKKRLWSVTRIQDPKHPGHTVRIAEYVPNGMLHVFRWIDGRQVSRSLKKTRAQLGTTPREQEREARRLGCLFIEELVTQPDTPTAGHSNRPLTIRALADRYEEEGFDGRTAAYKRDSLAGLRRIAKVLDDVSVQDITPSVVQRYMERRKAEGHPVAGRSDLLALSIAINWACGEKLLKENPLADRKVRAKMKLTAKPARPVADKARVQALKAVADQLPPAFGVLLDLAWNTGHRISAILELRWQDISFDKTEDAPFGAITWYVGTTSNNKRHQHTLPINSAAGAALRAWRKETKAIASAFVFSSLTDPKKGLERHVVMKWLARAEKVAKLPHVKRGGWHMFRRGWATARKSFPLKDVMEGGGWSDTQSVLKCYQHADQETTRKVVLTVA